MSRLTDIDAALRESFPEAVLEVHDQVDDVIVVDAARIVEVLRALRDDWAFKLLSDVSGVDWLPREPRYDVNYHLYSIANDDRLRVKVRLPDTDARLASVYEVYPAADWHEREVFDFFGIVFEGHPDLKRILMPEEWIGHPLRKDYPVGGVPVEYRIEPAYVGPNLVPERAQPSSGGIPARLRRDRGQRSHWTWTGEPSSGMPRRGRPEPPEEPEDQGGTETKQDGST